VGKNRNAVYDRMEAKAIDWWQWARGNNTWFFQTSDVSQTSDVF